MLATIFPKMFKDEDRQVIDGEFIEAIEPSAGDRIRPEDLLP